MLRGYPMDVILPDQLDTLTERSAVPPLVEAGAPSELARFSQQLRALSSLNTRLICMEADQPVYDQMVEGVARVLNIEICGLFMARPETEQLFLEGVVGVDVPVDQRFIAFEELARPAIQAFQEEYLVHVIDTYMAPGASPMFPDVRSLMALPIIGREGAVGVFEFARRDPGGFDASQIDLASMLVDQMAYQLENYRLVRQLSSSRDAVIHGMARLAESRGGDMGGHIDRICAYSQLLARRLQGMPGYLGEVTDEWVATLTRAAALHDIGKVAIPDAILLKPGRLTEDEYDVMRTHAELGSTILRDLMATHGAFPMLEMGTDVALCHHERWDGEGYPNGMFGDQIPLCARIVTVADVYDALTSKRVYKEAWSQDETLAQLRSMAGSHFDPKLVEVFLRDPDELEIIRRRFPD
jgi:HD-GYP domain-containing protein (c-di-GMP phosphodiesterase class II)